jgi:hypothetical protein
LSGDGVCSTTQAAARVQRLWCAYPDMQNLSSAGIVRSRCDIYVDFFDCAIGDFPYFFGNLTQNQKIN